MLTEGVTEASKALRPVVLAVHEDELAYMLVELNLVRPPSYQSRRYQVITVQRDGKLHDWWTDLGPAKDFPAPQIAIPGLFEETVGSLRDVAEIQRDHGPRQQKRIREMEAESTLIPDMLAQHEQGKRIIANQSSFGPLVSRPRNGFDTRAFHDRINR